MAQMPLLPIVVAAVLSAFNVALYWVLANSVGRTASGPSWVWVAYWAWDVATTALMLAYVVRQARAFRQRRVTAGTPSASRARLIGSAMLLFVVTDILLFEVVEHDFGHLASRFPWFVSVNRWWSMAASFALILLVVIGQRRRAPVRNGDGRPS